ncbi:MAG: hypothetical protein H6591_09945 [Flavobacteriales bacterium]|nr:hypothetical protein [Flavobacteriales bacterium]
MIKQTFLGMALMLIPAVLPVPTMASTVLRMPDGGPPSVRLSGQAGGDINQAQWDKAARFELTGCVAGAHVTELTLCIKDCTGKDASLRSVDATITPAMRKMIANLPVGTPFTVKVVVKDAKDQAWDVPVARYVWKG